MSTEIGRSKTSAGALGRWLPLAGLVALMAVAFAMGWHKLLTFKTVGLNYDALKAFVDRNMLGAVGLYMAIYTAIVALSLPGALFMTLTGGLLFGWAIGTPATVVSATIGATIIYLVARTSLGEGLSARAGPWIAKLRQGFQDSALSYLLFLRLVPAIPFVVVNLAAAVLGVPLRAYVIGTFLGIIPASAAYTVAGAGLGSVIEAQNVAYKACLAKAPPNPDLACPYSIDTGALVTKELIAAFALLGLVALIPPLLKRRRERNAAT